MRVSSFALVLATSLSLLACGPRDRDRLDDNALASATEGRKAEPDMRCGALPAQEEVKRQLFARAAEIRGSNSDDYASIAGFAVLQLDGAASDAPGAATRMVECRAKATLRLPAGLKVAGGRTTLVGDVGYSIAPGERGTVTLGQADSIALPLATLTQNRPAAPVAAPPLDEVESSDPLAPGDAEPEFQPAPATTNVARPSFDCRAARTDGEVAVCDNPTLAALDRVMAAQYRAAIARADALQGRQLRESRDRFLGFRDRCPSESCIDGAYRGRMREIDDIMAHRWQGRLYQGE
jgi:uncharacterized protein YecT (DUF1311 family)